MKRFSLLTVITILCLGSINTAWAATTKTITYKTVGTRALQMHLHFPKNWQATDTRPAMIFFFGGGWNNGTVDQFLPQAEYFASRGLVTARADYRVKSRDGVTPDRCVADARSAVRWLRQHAKELGINPRKLISSGGSAGGHLAACMIIEKSVETPGDDLAISTIPQAMVLYNPVLSFEHDKLRQRLGDKQHLARAISPTAHLNKQTPPALILFGTNDQLKAFGDAYRTKAEGLSVRAQEYLAEGKGHGFFNQSPWLERTTIAADQFLVSLGLLEGKPTVTNMTASKDRDGQGSARQAPQQRRVHPNARRWPALFKPDLSNALYDKGVWTVTDGVLTASEDKAIWTEKEYDNFILDLEFKTAKGTNSGVIVYCSDIRNWIPNSVEIQIADDHSHQQGKANTTGQCGAAYGRLGPTKSMVKKPGLWNRFTIRCRDHQIDVALNGEGITSMDMRKWTDPKKNPDGTNIPPWLSKPLSTLPTKGRIGFQGKHAGAPIWFRNLKIRELTN